MLALGVLSSACLVTENVEFERPTNPPIVWGRLPEPFAHVPSQEPACRDEAATKMYFSGQVTDLDVDEPLYGLFWVNGGSMLPPFEIPPTMDRSTQRTVKQCLAKAAFDDHPCNEVMLAVHPNSIAIYSPPSPEPAYEFGVWRWFVLGPASEVPEASPADCVGLFLVDGGVLADGGALGDGGVP